MSNKNKHTKSKTLAAFFTFCLLITPEHYTFATYRFEKLFIHKLNINNDSVRNGLVNFVQDDEVMFELMHKSIAFLQSLQ